MSTESERNSKWNKLLSFPFNRFSHPLVVDDNDEFMVMASKSLCHNAGGIYKFNTQKNEWTKIFDYDKNFECIPHSATYDNKNKLLYICDISVKPSKMTTFDLKTKNKVTSNTEQDICFGLIFVEDKLHKICNENGDHYIYD
eukprot:551595_1